ncbi:MAG: hypothetical protein V1837_04735 [Candidatus Woesearchaeota archaeon]
MVTEGHKIKERIVTEDFLTIVNQYTLKGIKCSSHAFFRLSEKQRKVIKQEDLIGYIVEKQPILVGKQNNGLYVAYYDFTTGQIIKMLLDISVNSIEIVTFYVTNKKDVPVIK